MKSKRCAFRFISDNQSVSYKTAYDAGEALLVNISTGGCAIKQLSLPLEMDEKVLLSFPLPGIESSVEAQGVVVRVGDDGHIAIRFTCVEPEDQATIRIHFSKQMRKKKQ